MSGRTAGAFISLRLETGSKNSQGQAMYSQVLVSVGAIAFIHELDKGRCEIEMNNKSILKPANWISEIEFMIEERTAFSVGRYDYRSEAETLQAYRESKLGWKPREREDIQTTSAIVRPGEERDTAPTDSDRVGAPSTCLDCGDALEDGSQALWHGGEGPLCNDHYFDRMVAERDDVKEIQSKPEVRNELMMLQYIVDANPDLAMDALITKLEAYSREHQIINLNGLASQLKNLPTELPF